MSHLNKELWHRIGFAMVVIGMLFGMATATAARQFNLPALDGSSTLPSEPPPQTDVPAPDTPQSLLQLTDIALRNNPQTRSAWADVRAHAAALGIARAAYWPQLSATLSVSRQNTRSRGGVTTSNTATRYGPAINLSYLLWDFGARAGATDAAQAELIGARLTRNQTFQDVILTVEQRYYQVQGLLALAQADRKTVDSAQASVDAARKRHKSGLSTIGDVYRAQASLAQAELTLQQTRGDLSGQRGALASALGFSPATELRLQPWMPDKAGRKPAHSVKQVLAQARQARPELLAAKASEQAARARVRQATGQRLPTIRLNAGAGHTHVVDQDSFADYSVGAEVDIPLFSGFELRSRREQAEAQLTQTAAQTQLLRQQVETDVWQAYQAVLTAHKNLDSSAVLLKSAKRSESVARGRYQAGLGTIIDLLTAQATLADARASRVQARVAYYSALATLGHAAGGLPVLDNGDNTP